MSARERIVELVIEVGADDLEAAERVGWALGAQGLETRDEETGAPPGRAQVVVWLPATIDVAAVERGVHDAIEHATTRTRTIEATWLEPPAHREIGRRFVVVPLDAEAAPLDTEVGLGGRIAVRIDGSLTFGDGLHPTTGLCVEALEALFDARAPSRVLDVGTGTGILAICAAKLGAASVAATDVDALARHAAQRHADANAVELRISEQLPDGRFDLVLANLYAQPLCALAARIAERVADDGTLVISGFGGESQPDVEAAFADARLRVVERRSRDGWLCVRLERAGA